MARPREFDEREVVGQALEVFWSQGYQATSVQDLVNATGLERGSLYGAFGDKRGLFTSCLDAYMAHAHARFDAMVGAAEDPAEGLRAFVRAAGEDCRYAPVAGRGCLLGNTFGEIEAHDEATRDRVEGYITGMQTRMASALRRAQRLGTFDPRRDARAVGTLIQCSLQGLSILSRSRPSARLVRATTEEIVRILD